MATRSIIMHRQGARTNFIYCHFDGYPSHHLPILKQYYNTSEKVAALLRLGDLSVLGPKIGREHGPRKTNECLAYGRDFGDKNTTHSSYHNLENVIAFAKGIDYAYWFHDGKWSCLLRPAVWNWSRKIEL